MITQAQVEKYGEIYRSSGRAVAQDYAREIIQAFNLQTPSERGALWDSFKAAQVELEAATAVEKATAAKKKKDTASIKKTCEAVLAKRSITFRLKVREALFLNDIQTKRKLTEKQEKWLRALAEKANVEIDGKFENRVSRARKHDRDCDHQDLGSLGYTHGTVVTCPQCGQRAEVW